MGGLADGLTLVTEPAHEGDEVAGAVPEPGQKSILCLHDNEAGSGPVDHLAHPHQCPQVRSLHVDLHDVRIQGRQPLVQSHGLNRLELVITA
jgi:hypothetical protein